MSERFPNLHPGDIIREDFLKPLGLTPKGLAARMGVLHETVLELIRGRIPVTPELAAHLSGALGRSKGFWLNLQQLYDDEEEARRMPALMPPVAIALTPLREIETGRE